MSSEGFTPMATRKWAETIWSAGGSIDSIKDMLEQFEHAVRDDEARAAANRVENLPWLDGGRTVNRNQAIVNARRGLQR